MGREGGIGLKEEKLAMRPVPVRHSRSSRSRASRSCRGKAPGITFDAVFATVVSADVADNAAAVNV